MTTTSTARMNPDIKAAWLARLRDPRTKQGHGMLRTDDDKFCCLGVLCDVLKRPATFSTYTTRWSYDDLDALPSLKLYALTGLATAQRQRYFNPPLPWGDTAREILARHGYTLDNAEVARLSEELEETFLLTALNDAGVSFACLADLIEALL